VTGRGRQVTGVTQAAAGGSATGAAPDTSNRELTTAMRSGLGYSLIVLV